MEVTEMEVSLWRKQFLYQMEQTMSPYLVQWLDCRYFSTLLIPSLFPLFLDFNMSCDLNLISVFFLVKRTQEHTLREGLLDYVA